MNGPKTIAVIALLGLGVLGGPVAAVAEWNVAELESRVFVTEDRLEEVPGCDAISVIDAASGDATHRGSTRPSPGRIAVHPQGNLALATQVNSLSVIAGQLSSDPFLHLAIQDERDASRWHHGEIIGTEFALFGGILILPSDLGFVVATSRLVPARLNGFARNGRPFKVERFPLPTRGRAQARVGKRIASFEIDGTAVEILPSPDFAQIHVLTEHGTVYSLSAERLDEVSTRVSLAPIVARKNRIHDRPLQLMHASISADGRYLVANRGDVNEISVVDLEDRRAWTLRLPDDIPFVGGVALNRAWVNSGLLAVHTIDSVRVFAFSPEGPLVERGRLAIEPPRFQELGQGHMDHLGPQNAIEWTGNGARIVAATDLGSAEFIVVSVEENGRALNIERLLTACSLAGFNLPNDIVTLNGFLSPPHTATPITTPSQTKIPTPSPSATLTSTPTFVKSATPTASSVSTSTSSPTAAPKALYMPLLLRESCEKELRRVDILMVIDASTSMQEPTSAGRSKLDAARDAAMALVDELDFAAGDQGGLVIFNEDAVASLALGSSRSELEAALAAAASAPGTCVPCGLAAAEDLLFGPEHRLENTPALILLTDGESNVQPISEAIPMAERMKDQGAQIFTIGLGAEVEEAELRQIASNPDHYFGTTDAEALELIFERILIEIPCPPSDFWSGR